MSNNRYCEQCKYMTEHRTSGHCSKLNITIPKERLTKQCVRCTSCFENGYKDEGDK